MVAWNIVVSIIAALLILEGLLVALLPKQVTKILKKVLKNKKQLITLGAIEALIGVIILIAVLYLS